MKKFIAADEKVRQLALADLMNALAKIETILQKQSYLVGSEVLTIFFRRNHTDTYSGGIHPIMGEKSKQVKSSCFCHSCVLQLVSLLMIVSCILSIRLH